MSMNRCTQWIRMAVIVMVVGMISTGTGCVRGSSPFTYENPTHKELTRVVLTWADAINTRNAELLLSLYPDNGLFRPLGSDQLVTKQEYALRASVELEQFAANNLTLKILHVVFLEATETKATCLVKYTATTPERTVPVLDKFQFILEDGTWKMANERLEQQA